MIHVDRASVEAPPTLLSDRARAALVRLEEFFAVPLESRRQRTVPVDPRLYTGADVKRTLTDLFHGKCAYCETPLDSASAVQVDQFRPKLHAVNHDGSVAPDGYWWLTYEWENLYPACSNCNHLKASRFPVEGTRAAPGTRGPTLNAERPLLLDPCADDPDEHLVFTEDGRVASETERGRVTVNVLGLNRDTLVRDRLAEMKKLRSEFAVHAFSKRTRQTRHVVMAKLARADAPYAGARRQLLARLAAKEAPTLTVDPALGGVKVRGAARIKKATHDFDVRQHAQESYSIADESQKADYFVRTRAIARIEIHNFRPIADLTLRFPDPVRDDDRPEPDDPAVGPDRKPKTPWLMLLGENASGKSSVLQAVALALIGDEWRNRLNLEASRYVRKGAKSGYVKVYLVGVKDPIQLTFSLASKDFTSEPKEPKVLLLGYGSTRLLPRHGTKPSDGYDFARIDNLLNPFVPLNDAGGWMATLDNATFDTVARALRPILQLKEGDALVREPSGIPEADLLGARVTLDELSDGYQSVVALATDIMRVMLKRWNAIEIAEGIVVLDEIGSHLHPQWRMRIVSALREAFPRVQFLASTHDPLCLRGLNTGEVVVMKRDARKRVAAVTDLPAIGGLRVDQLLTSEYFGLSSTIDPQLEGVFNEYYGLLALRKPTAAQRSRIAALKAELDKVRVMGSNERERLMLEAIDQYLAERKAAPGRSNARSRAAATKRLTKIWAETPPAPRPAGGSRT